MGRRILIVEDERDVRVSIAAVLEAAGYRVDTASNGAEAFELLAQGAPPAAIVLDLMMPVMSGDELLANLRMFQSLRHVPVVGITASAFGRVRAGDFDAFLPKPFDARELEAVVAAAIAHGRS